MFCNTDVCLSRGLNPNSSKRKKCLNTVIISYYFDNKWFWMMLQNPECISDDILLVFYLYISMLKASECLDMCKSMYSAALTGVSVVLTVSSVLSEVALRRSTGMDQTGTVVWHLALCLLLSSIIVGAALIRGIKSSGKVSLVPNIYVHNICDHM